MHNRELITLVIVGFVSLALGARNEVFSQEKMPPTDVQSSPNQNAGRSISPGINLQASPNQAVIDEISEIRRQLGGGLSIQLQELEIQSPWRDNPPIVSDLNQDFDQEIQRLASGSMGTGSMGTGRSSQSASDVGESGDSVKFMAQPSRRSATLDQSKVRRLRDSARRLDEMAAELEEVSLYEDADQIRAQARDFWLKARQTKTLSSDDSSRN